MPRTSTQCGRSGKSVRRLTTSCDTNARTGVSRRHNSRPITPRLLISAALILGGVARAILYRAGQPEVTTGNV